MSCKISWSSPEDEQLSKPIKQSKQWRKFHCIDPQNVYLSTPEKHSRLKSCNSNADPSQELLIPSPSILNDLEESPIIGASKVSDSPLIKEYFISSSPIIGKKRKRRYKTCKDHLVQEPTLKDIAKSEIKRKFPPTFDQKFKILEIKPKNKMELLHSPDVFPEASPIIEINESPTDKTQYAISQVNSQNCSIVINSSTISPQSNRSLESLYYQIPEKKKKRFKRGGLASQVQKQLKSEGANVAIFKHESYLCKNGTYAISPLDENLIISVKVQKVWNEFQSTYALCCISNGDKILVLINSEYVDVNKLQISTLYKIYPPYSEHAIFYNKEHIKCFINVTRLKKLDEFI